MDDIGIEAWRGGVNVWQCDQMGHLNVRFYVAHAMEGLAALAAALGMPRAFSPGAASTLIVREHHIRFLKEARAGQGLNMRAGLLSFDEDAATALQIVRHSGGEEAAAVFQTRLVHARAETGVHVFPWPPAMRVQARALAVTVPDGLGPRSLEPGADDAGVTLAHARDLGLWPHAMGAFRPDECDLLGRVTPHAIMGRISDGAAHSVTLTREAFGDLGEEGRRIGMAVVEYRLTYFGEPRAGDRFEVLTGLAEVLPRRLRFAHWMFEADTGRPLARADAVLLVFDLDTRKSLTLPDAALKALQGKAVEGLT
ncbi:MAG: thioesterase family protein [Caulobacteraceae bacterium]